MYKRFMQALVATSAVLLVGIVDVHALPKNGIETTFYSDASLSTEVGFRLLTCDGRVVRKGKVTKFATRTVTKCHVSNPLPKPKVPCDFKPEGCGHLPKPR